MTIGGDRSYLDGLMDAYRAGEPRATEGSDGARKVRTVQCFFRAVVGSDDAALSAIATDNLEMEVIGPATLPIAGHWSGRGRVAAAMRAKFHLFTDQQAEIVGVVAQENAVLVMGREMGRVIASGAAYHVHGVHWFTFREEKLCRLLEIFDNQAIWPSVLGSPFLSG